MNLCIFFNYFFYICIVNGEQSISGGGRALSTGLTPPHFYASPKLGHGFARSYFIVIVDIGGIVDHHYLKHCLSTNGSTCTTNSKSFIIFI
jgi:hypothetical protein